MPKSPEPPREPLLEPLLSEGSFGSYPEPVESFLPSPEEPVKIDLSA